MNRKVILISGNDGLAFEQKTVLTEVDKLIQLDNIDLELEFGQKMVAPFVDKLIQLDNIDLEVVGNGEQNLTIDEISKSLDTVLPEQDVTIIIQSHGTMKSGFEFCISNDFSISSKELFQMIRLKLGNKPIDIFTAACYGGGMLLDKEELAEGSTLVSLTSLEEPNFGFDYQNMIEHFETFSGEVTAYNLLEFYLVNFLKNRSKPFIAISGQTTIYDLDKFLSSGEARNISFDSEHFSSTGELPNYLNVFQKLQNLKSKWDINAVNYGLAMSICLNELKNKGLVRNHNERLDNNKTR